MNRNLAELFSLVESVPCRRLLVWGNKPDTLTRAVGRLSYPRKGAIYNPLGRLTTGAGSFRTSQLSTRLDELDEIRTLVPVSGLYLGSDFTEPDWVLMRSRYRAPFVIFDQLNSIQLPTQMAQPILAEYLDPKVTLIGEGTTIERAVLSFATWPLYHSRFLLSATLPASDALPIRTVLCLRLGDVPADDVWARVKRAIIDASTKPYAIAVSASIATTWPLA